MEFSASLQSRWKIMKSVCTGLYLKASISNYYFVFVPLTHRDCGAFLRGLFTQSLIYLPSHSLKRKKRKQLIFVWCPIYYALIHKCSYMSEIAPEKVKRGGERHGHVIAHSSGIRDQFAPTKIADDMVPSNTLINLLD